MQFFTRKLIQCSLFKVEASKQLLLKSLCAICKNNIKTLLIFCVTTSLKIFFYNSRVFESQLTVSRCILYYKTFTINNNSVFTLQFLLNFKVFDKILTNIFHKFPNIHQISNLSHLKCLLCSQFGYVFNAFKVHFILSGDF